MDKKGTEVVAVDAAGVAETREGIDNLCQVIDQGRRFWTHNDCVNMGGYTNGAAWFLEKLSTKKFAKTWKLQDGDFTPLLIEQMEGMAWLADEIETFPETTQPALPGVDLAELRAALVESVMEAAKSMYFNRVGDVPMRQRVLAYIRSNRNATYNGMVGEFIAALEDQIDGLKAEVERVTISMENDGEIEVTDGGALAEVAS